MYPNIRTFLDIGGNRGYTAAQFFGLWSPGYNFNRISLYNALKTDSEASLLRNNAELNTFCGDGKEGDDPIFCIGRPAPNQCQFRRPISVYSFDGQRSHVEDAIGITKRHFPRIHSNYSTANPDLTKVRAKWEYFHAAF